MTRVQLELLIKIFSALSARAKDKGTIERTLSRKLSIVKENAFCYGHLQYRKSPSGMPPFHQIRNMGSIIRISPDYTKAVSFATEYPITT